MTILSGPGDVLYEATQVVKTITSKADKPGSSVSSYDNRRLENVGTNNGITKLGPTVGTYDPEWQAWLAGEI